MTTNLEIRTLPALTLPRLSSKLEDLADNLALFAVEFGIEFDGRFAGRLATIGFANGVVLGLREAGPAGKLEELLCAEAIPPAGEIQGLGASFIGEFQGDTDWPSSVNRFLAKRWNASADRAPNLEFLAETRLRVLHAIRAGLVLAREDGEAAGRVSERTKVLRVEDRFLSSCLYSWSNHDWIPYWHPFVEFTAAWYKPGSAERWVLTAAVAEVIPVARALNNPWDVPFWAETGWNGGRKFVRNNPRDCRKMVDETGGELLKAYHGLYKRFVLGTVRPEGEIQIGRAALRYIGALEDDSLARSVCTGEEPRHLARRVFDFTFWMGIFSAHPLPDAAT